MYPSEIWLDGIGSSGTVTGLGYRISFSYPPYLCRSNVKWVAKKLVIFQTNSQSQNPTETTSFYWTGWQHNGVDASASGTRYGDSIINKDSNGYYAMFWSASNAVSVGQPVRLKVELTYE